ncbi:hypothetical protein SJC15_44 [Bacteroides phage SJC15]|nr:hypothetical protein SJC15_44 [Bacteroides phage SJC15]QIG65317.1 hypothetical protein SJC16_44 [Bacteroides phage SJC16]QIG65461.1 hypothetical protein SJC20_43 [Bacteroides phage SJC20]
MKGKIAERFLTTWFPNEWKEAEDEIKFYMLMEYPESVLSPTGIDNRRTKYVRKQFYEELREKTIERLRPFLDTYELLTPDEKKEWKARQRKRLIRLAIISKLEADAERLSKIIKNFKTVREELKDENIELV